MRKLKLAGCCLAVPLTVIAVVLAWWNLYATRPASSSYHPVNVRVKRGESPTQVANMLEERGVIRSRWAFLWTLGRRGGWTRIRSGAYRLSPDMRLSEIADRLEQGPRETGQIKVTIPEGFTARQIAQTLAARQVVPNPETFLTVAESDDPPVSAPFTIPSSGLEGYLYPETYLFKANMRPEKVAQEMVDTFVSRFYRPNKAAIQASHHSLNQIVTIASLIEREAEVPQDRPRIAGVIENRLSHKMRLQIDASVLYAEGHHKSRVTYADLNVDSPYNTYRHAGLPPGPIASPGLDALTAALNPERNPYLFYVAGPGGAHVFSRTEAEHLQNVARFRALRAKQTLQ